MSIDVVNPTSSHKKLSRNAAKYIERFFVQKKNDRTLGIPFSFQTSSTFSSSRSSLHGAAHLAGPIQLLGRRYAGNTGLDGEIMDDVSILPKQDVSNTHEKLKIAMMDFGILVTSFKMWGYLGLSLSLKLYGVFDCKLPFMFYRFFIKPRFGCKS